jgi:hypothetical protein
MTKPSGNMMIRRDSPLLTAARWSGLVIVLACASLPAGCASSGTDTAMAAVPARGPINTGTFPNLNVPPRVAAPPMTQDDTARLTGQIASAQAAQAASGSGGGTSADPARLQTLAERHGDDTLKAIAAQ